MSITKLFPSGAWEISDMIKGYLVRRIYFNCTKKQAISEFKSEMKGA